MTKPRPIKQIVVSVAVLILTFWVGFVTGGIQKTMNPEDCNRALRERTGTPEGEQP